jgi:hypothetical protein
MSSAPSTTQQSVEEATAKALSDYNVRLRMFLLRLTDPDDLGHAVTPEVRRLAAELAASNRKHY